MASGTAEGTTATPARRSSVRGQFAGGGLHFGDAGGALVEALGFFELHFGAGAVAGLLGGVLERCAAGAQELFHAGGFAAIFLDRHDGLAGAQAAVHLAIDAAGVGGRGLEIFFAAADLEEVEQFGVEMLGGGAGGERSVVEAAAEARRHHGARELVVEREAQECGRAEADDARPVFGEILLREFEVSE